MAQHRIGKTPLQGQLDVAEQVWGVHGNTQILASLDPIEEGPTADPADLLPDRHRVHRHAYDTSGSRPHRALAWGVNRSSEQKTPRSRILVDCPLDCAEHAGHRLPLVEQGWL